MRKKGVLWFISANSDVRAIEEIQAELQAEGIKCGIKANAHKT